MSIVHSAVLLLVDAFIEQLRFTTWMEEVGMCTEIVSRNTLATVSLKWSVEVGSHDLINDENVK